MSDGVYTKTKYETRKKNGNFSKYKEVGHYKGTHSGKHRVCSCCHKDLEITRNPNALYCNLCAEYIKKIRWRNSTTNKRLRNELEKWKSYGCIGRIEQQLKYLQNAKRIEINLRQKVNYYKKKCVLK